MPRTLRYLIMASGSTGSAGQSFRNHVAGAASGAAMSHYLIPSVAISGVPAGNTALTAYPDSFTFSIQNLFTRGSRAHFIQRNDMGAYAFTDIENPGSGQVAQASITAFVVQGDGWRHDITVNVKAPPVGTYNHNPHGYNYGVEPQFGGQQWPAEFWTEISTTGGGTAQLITLAMAYNPDTGPFNSQLTNGSGWTFWQENRVYGNDDFDYRWFFTSHNGTAWERSGATPFWTGRAAPAVQGCFFGTDNLVKANADGTNNTAPYARAWLQARNKDHLETAWVDIGMGFAADPRFIADGGTTPQPTPRL
jgi:hypothetical protein